MKKVINRGERSKTLNEVKPVENISIKEVRDKSCAKGSFFYISFKTMHIFMYVIESF